MVRDSGNLATERMRRLETEVNSIIIDAYNLREELSPDVTDSEVTLSCNPVYKYGEGLSSDEIYALQRLDASEDLISYAIGCYMGRYSLDEPGIIYANERNSEYDVSRYKTFKSDLDGIIPNTDEPWFSDDATGKVIEFVASVWPAEKLESNIRFIASGLEPNSEDPARQIIRRYLSNRFYKKHCQAYKRHPIYWHFSSGKHQAFQCLVYLHRYNAETLGRMRADYVIPLQGKLQGRLATLAEEVARAGSTAQRKQAQKAFDLIDKKIRELAVFDDQLRSYADKRIELDLDDGVKVNIRKFGTLIDLKPLGNLDSDE